MPNHVKNRLEIIGTEEQVKEVFEKLNTFHPETQSTTYDGLLIFKNDSGEYGWLNTETNEFKTRNGEVSNIIPDGFEKLMDSEWNHFPDFNKVIPQPENMFKGPLSNDDEEECARKGIPTWYDFNCKEWGTKWNSYSCEKESENVFTFETAWSAPLPIIHKIAEMFPNIRMIYQYADEDTGSNCGIGIIENGVALISPLKNHSYHAYRLAFSLRPDSAKCYIDDGETINSRDCDECGGC